MTCPNCGAAEQRGNFCSECGAELARECPECGRPVAPHDQFCADCGEELGSRSARSFAPWWIAAAAALVVVLILFIPERADRAGPRPMVDPGATAPAGTGMGGFTGDLRTDADRLFNRVMTAAAAGDQQEVDQFMPMATQAYEMVPDLDHDGLFHLAVLYETAGDHDQARATAERILRDEPNHLLGLGVAGSAAAQAGDTAAAASYYQRLLDGYESESARLLPEYVHHAAMMEQYRSEARSFLES